MYGERSRAQMREATSVHPPFSIFYCGCKQPKSIHMSFSGAKLIHRMRISKYISIFQRLSDPAFVG